METLSNRKSRVNGILGIYKALMSESILLAIFLFPIHLNRSDQTISWMVLLILAISFLVPLFLFKCVKLKFTFLFYLAPMLIIIVGSFITGIPLLISILLFVFSHWRLYKLLPENINDEYFDHRNGLLLLTIILGVGMYCIGLLMEFSDRNSLFILILIQFIILTYGTFIQNYLQSNFKKKYALFLIALLIIIIPLVLAIILIFPIIGLRKGMFEIITLFVQLITFLIGPLLEYLLNKLESRMSKVTEENENMDLLELNDEHIEQAFHEGNQNIFYIILFIATIIFALWAFFKFRRFRVHLEELDKDDLTLHQTLKKNKKGLIYSPSNPGYSKASHQIRKCVYELEKNGIKKKIGRKSSESIRDWVNRIQIDCSNKWISIYEKVRYGKGNVAKSEVEFFLAEYKLIKKQFKDRKHMVLLEKANYNSSN
ncbi:hypothetical protein ACQKCU_11735 [Heyndrickxia sporothermodurans]